MNTQTEKPDFIVDEFGTVQDVRYAKSSQEPAPARSWMPDSACKPEDTNSSELSRAAQSQGRPLHLIPIPIGLLISLLMLLISSISHGGTQRADVRFDEANNNLENGNIEQAIAMYGDAIQQDPGLWEAVYNRGLAHYEDGNLEVAIADFDRALQLKPDLVRAYSSRGITYLALDETDKAIADFDEAIQRTPRYMVDLWTDPRHARVETIPDYLKDSPSAIDLPLVYVYRGLAYLAKGDSDKALVDLDQALQLNPDLAYAYYARGVARYAMGDYDRAIADLRTVLSLDENSEVREDAEVLLNELGVSPEIQTSWPAQL